ncbi:FAD-binding domain containing protein [Parasponia andersonii]|uniref:FAD-binding domain containing protein n=1 Tax=Parasponia andersonii TaxID=3476 RepID=A0A2P5A7J0_PARAD|nr:FAD-binding domain containing protein [Parasponia andersonii]
MKIKVLIGCDGVNSVVAKWLGFKSPAFTERSAIRAFAEFEDDNGFESKELWFIRNGYRSAFIPCDDMTLYRFLHWVHSMKGRTEKSEIMENPSIMKQIALRKLNEIPDKVKATIQITEVDNIAFTTIRYRLPWDLIWGNISKGNECVAGDAFHPMTPYIGQGGCATFEDGVVLASCLAKALLSEKSEAEREEYERIELGLKKYSNERRWRGVELVTVAYMAGYIQNRTGVLISFLRDKFLAKLLTKVLRKLADYDCKDLNKA